MTLLHFHLSLSHSYMTSTSSVSADHEAAITMIMHGTLHDHNARNKDTDPARRLCPRAVIARIMFWIVVSIGLAISIGCSVVGGDRFRADPADLQGYLLLMLSLAVPIIGGMFALFFNGRFLKLYGIGICSCQPALPPGEGYHDVD